MAEERKAEDFPLEKPSLGDNPPEEGTGAYDSMMASYNSSMADYETRLDAWLKGEVNADAPDAADGQSPDTQPEVEGHSPFHLWIRHVPPLPCSASAGAVGCPRRRGCL